MTVQCHVVVVVVKRFLPLGCAVPLACSGHARAHGMLIVQYHHCGEKACHWYLQRHTVTAHVALAVQPTQLPFGTAIAIADRQSFCFYGGVPSMPIHKQMFLLPSDSLQ